MKLVIANSPVPDTQSEEIVERKGIGHPDTICDGLAESISRALSRHYVEQFGRVLHHNVDKVLLRGGSSSPTFGGGEITAPIEICLGGRATHEVQGKGIPVKELALRAATEWFQAHLPDVNVQKDVRLNCLIRPGSRDLVELFLRQNEPLANDTSVGVGFAPFSPLEKAVLDTDRFLHDAETRTTHPQTGADTKVMGFCNGDCFDLTVACAFIAQHISSLDDYFSKKDALTDALRSRAEVLLGKKVLVSLNAADDKARESIYLTVSGTSAEAGDDGEVGRGNRITGLITPHRPMSLEAAAGKNPVNHTGKLYQIAAQRIAESLIGSIPELTHAQCFLLSQIGSPISEPKFVSIRVHSRVPIETLRRQIEEVLRDGLKRMPLIQEEILAGKHRVF